MGNANMIKIYNDLVRRVVTKLTMHHGTESPEARMAQYKMYRMVRRDYSYTSQMRSTVNG